MIQLSLNTAKDVLPEHADLDPDRRAVPVRPRAVGPDPDAVLLTLRRGPAYPADLAESAGVSRQTMPNHLTCLRGCGLVVSVPEGRRSRYELADERIGHALNDLLDLVPWQDVCA